eukprot:TRINITY_DN11335_c0_g1_i1.p1 TRINITY_DN11335_c0_g1~~TRINITY_DN11335_c0_g1_i1.p1  ORF type:complete len:115 (+),score=3.95 TRINITY_DN11335_c0_g1_i1:325-669(+)
MLKPFKISVSEGQKTFCTEWEALYNSLSGSLGCTKTTLRISKNPANSMKHFEKGNKSYRIFCAVGEKCFGHKLDYYLKLPVKRLPQYLRLLAKVYDLIPNKGTAYANDLGKSIF